jgi:hypothetical protein
MRNAKLQIENGREAAYIRAWQALRKGSFSGALTTCRICGYEGEIAFEAVRLTGFAQPHLERTCPQCNGFYYEEPYRKPADA